MKHLLMDPAFPDLVGEWARTEGDPFGAQLDPGFFARLDEAETAADIAEAIIIAAALQDIAETRVW